MGACIGLVATNFLPSLKPYVGSVIALSESGFANARGMGIP